MRSLIPVCGAVLAVLLDGCSGASPGSSVDGPKLPGETPLETLRMLFEASESEDFYYVSDNQYFVYLNNEEILSTLEIDDLVELPGSDLAVAFYSYRVASLKTQNTRWMRKMGDRWALSNIYVSEYNWEEKLPGQQEDEVKKLLDRIELWSTDEFWWN